ncbi:hypothetical protein QE369_003774 [Agrobacterium larrymoorei]|uniref:Lytic murein transglycosylase n=1 Tax=Agrobacterium larrymoorei TaxID=160699 RepID=A0AAJ2BER5_9HYPH|nr:hypothetical protein [Agrobacterium larrymoorei]
MSVLKRAALTPLCPAGHLPRDQQEARSPRSSLVLPWTSPYRDSISPLGGEMPGRAEGGPQQKPQRRLSKRGSTPR